MTNNQKPVITNFDLVHLIDLLDVFDRVTFNNDNEMVAKLNHTFPFFGELVVSYYANESHLQLYYLHTGRVVLNHTVAALWNSRDQLLVYVQNLLCEMRGVINENSQ